MEGGERKRKGGRGKRKTENYCVGKMLRKGMKKWFRFLYFLLGVHNVP